MQTRPALPPHSTTYNPHLSGEKTCVHPGSEPQSGDKLALPDLAQCPNPTVSVGAIGLVLKASVDSVTVEDAINVLVMEDNHILRDLLYDSSFILFVRISKSIVISVA